MSWIKIPMKFPGTCIVCNDKIEINEIGLWSKGTGVKHVLKPMNCNVLCVVPQLDVFNVNSKIFVIFQMFLNYVFVRNVVMKKMLIIHIKNHLVKNSLF